MKNINRYSLLIEKIFFKYYREGDKEILFKRTDITNAAKELKVELPLNLGDVIYSFRYRTELPESITSIALKCYEWVLLPAGRNTDLSWNISPWLLRDRIWQQLKSLTQPPV